MTLLLLLSPLPPPPEGHCIMGLPLEKEAEALMEKILCYGGDPTTNQTFEKTMTGLWYESMWFESSTIFMSAILSVDKNLGQNFYLYPCAFPFHKASQVIFCIKWLLTCYIWSEHAKKSGFISVYLALKFLLIYMWLFLSITFLLEHRLWNLELKVNLRFILIPNTRKSVFINLIT